ncbi:MAG: ABC transporter substrate-binding protein [ANME-2 cluster archaeon]|nr:ABC transporter substrate-binding protein [ANME-2 cluster archaeon]
MTPYQSASADDIPQRYIDPEGYWTGFGGRARILLVNTDLVPEDEYPESIFDLPNHSRVCIAYPMFGTSATHAAALYATLGPDETRDFYSNLQSSGARVVDGNSVVRDLVASGQLDMGLTDTDDACGAIRKGAPVKIIFLDQTENSLGTLIIPNSISLIKGSPNPDEAKILIDHLLSRQVEESLVASGWIQVSLRPVDIEPFCPLVPDIKDMNVSFHDIYLQNQQAKEDLREIFIQ